MVQIGPANSSIQNHALDPTANSLGGYALGEVQNVKSTAQIFTTDWTAQQISSGRFTVLGDRADSLGVLNDYTGYFLGIDRSIRGSDWGNAAN
jgi:hypothetical protein